MSGGETLRIGFFGKLPSHGDFVRDGLSRRFVEAWDAWLQAVWPGTADAAPPGDEGTACWRFRLAAGLCGPSPVSGLMLPSADSVGRRFPLLLALEGGAADDRLLDEFERIGRAAVALPLGRDAVAERLRAFAPIIAHDPAPPGARWWSAGREHGGESMPDRFEFAAFGFA